MWPRKSYAQMGEDLILENILNSKGIRAQDVKYLDIGVSHPIESNNTFLFYEKGARGVLVDPDPSIVKEIEHCRPEDKFVACAVAEYDNKFVDYYILTARTLNTIIKEKAIKMTQMPETYGKQNIINTMQIPTKNINSIISENFITCPNLISIDTEGMDYKIVKMIDFSKYAPLVICIEINEDCSEVKSFLQTKGYGAVCDNSLNLIFVR